MRSFATCSACANIKYQGHVKRVKMKRLHHKRKNKGNKMTIQTEEESDFFDYEDSKKLFAYSLRTAILGKEYSTSRKRFAAAQKVLKEKLGRAYQEGTINNKVAIEKAFILIAIKDEQAQHCLEVMTEEEGIFKGLELEISSRAGVVSLAQSLIRNSREVNYEQKE